IAVTPASEFLKMPQRASDAMRSFARRCSQAAPGRCGERLDPNLDAAAPCCLHASAMPFAPTRTPRSILAAAFAAAWPCAACAGGPSIAVAGAYFPAWLACALFGCVAALAARVSMVATGLARVLPLQLFVCASIGVLCGAAAWLAWTGV